MLHFTFLGTSSGVPTLSRNVSGLAVRNSKNKDWILVDAGEGTQHRIQQARLSLQNLIAICITRSRRSLLWPSWFTGKCRHECPYKTINRDCAQRNSTMV